MPWIEQKTLIDCNNTLNKQIYKIILPPASRDLLIACHELHCNCYSRSGEENKKLNKVRIKYNQEI